MRSGRRSTTAQAEDALVQVFREEAGRLTARLVRIIGNFDVAEEIVQDTLLVALEKWPKDGVPDRPAAWLATAAKRRAIDHLRRDARFRQKLELLKQELTTPESEEPDDRLRLIFTCCHPALSREAARAFLTTESAIAQRIVRARRKIVEAGIPYRVPEGQDLDERVQEVLAVLYLMFNEGYLASTGKPVRRDLAEDAEWLAGLVVRLLPAEPEAIGLLVLMRLHLARADARLDAAGDLVLLRDQDRSRWKRDLIAGAIGLLEQAGAMRRPGPYQLQAAIAACHAEAASWEATDWPQILLLYDALVRLLPTPVVRLNRAVALRHVRGAADALTEVDALAGELAGYHLFHATRAELL
ncbi:MAG: RNA polymerase sigma factor, partial [Chloroflexi bacterium]